MSSGGFISYTGNRVDKLTVLIIASCSYTHLFHRKLAEIILDFKINPKTLVSTNKGLQAVKLCSNYKPPIVN